jgi:hypothetical protein
MENTLVQFDEVRAAIAKYKTENENLVFNYDDLQGNKDARSHIFKLRKTKTQIGEIHRATKAEALAVCQEIDKEKRTLIANVEEMIEVHAAPIRAIEEKVEAERVAKVEAWEKTEREAEEKRQAELAEREADVAKREAEIKTQQDAINAKQAEAERVEREKRIAEEAAENAREQEQAEQERKRKEAEAEQERLAEIERKRIENKEHQSKIRKRIHIFLFAIVQNEEKTDEIVSAIVDGSIPNVTINY